MSNNCIILPNNGIVLATPIGTFENGGYFFGKINVGGQVYKLYLAPRASGQINITGSGLAYKPTGGVDTGLVSTINDGWSNTQARNSATFPICQWARGLTIGGFNDWYIPSRDELELICRNLRPTSSATTGTRPNSDGEVNVAYGVNNSSVPAGAAYTAGTMPQTSIVAFQYGNSESLCNLNENQYMWSSTQISTSTGQNFIQRVSDGSVQGGDNKPTASRQARAIRRVLDA